MLSKQELLVEIIKSRTFTNKIIQRFALKTVYNAKNMNMARKEFHAHLTIKPDFTEEKQFNLRRQRSPLTKISFRSNNAQKAAEIANAIVEELKLFVNKIAISEASQKRLFFENQLKQSHDSLIKSEEDMKAFQEKTGILEVRGEMNINIDKFAPALMLEYKRVFRQLKFEETLYEILVKQYEMAKIEESKDAFLLQVIDKAVPPEKLKKMRIFGFSKALGVTFMVFMFSCFLAFAKEVSERSANNKNRNTRIATLKRYLSFKS